MATLADYVVAVGARVPDDAGRLSDLSTSLGVTDVREARILAAVRTYSRARPRVIDATLTGDGTTQVWPAPTGWSQGFSTLCDYEYPIDQIPPVMVRPISDRLVVLRRDGVEQLGTVHALGAAEQARIHYQALHMVSASDDTVPASDFDAVADLAAALCCETLATFYAESTLSSLAADTVNHSGKAQLYADVAQMHFKRYVNHMSPAEGGDGAGTILMGDIDIPTGRGGGSDYLFARRSLR